MYNGSPEMTHGKDEQLIKKKNKQLKMDPRKINIKKPIFGPLLLPNFALIFRGEGVDIEKKLSTPI